MNPSHAPTQRVSISLAERSYDIHIGEGLLAQAQSWVGLPKARTALIVTNETVAPLYLQQVRQSLEGRSIAECVLPDGEAFKTQATLGKVYDALAEARITRDGAVIALGGGVIGDLAGFHRADPHDVRHDADTEFREEGLAHRAERNARGGLPRARPLERPPEKPC